MAARKTSMQKIREILRLKLVANLSIRKIASATKSSIGVVQHIISQAHSHQLTWPLDTNISDKQLQAMLYPSKTSTTLCVLPDFALMHQELKRKGMTKQLLWEEYAQKVKEQAYSYSQFCRHYLSWLAKQKRSMRQVHVAGEKCFVDYAGPTIPIVDGTTGEIRQAQIFVGTLGASNYTYAEATWTQSSRDWLMSHVRMFEYFGGTPALIVPDNLKSGVKKACYYDPEVNANYQHLAEHYQVAVLPTRPYRPKDKAKVEVAVQVVERWIMARLRHFTFFSLHDLNQTISLLLVDLNERPFKRLPGNRKEAFETLDKPALQALPKHPYQYVDIKQVKVAIDYHVSYEKHLYSVPHEYVGEVVQLHASEKMVFIYYARQLIASHQRHYQSGMSTQANHMPYKHHVQMKMTPGYIKTKAREIGVSALEWMSACMASKDHVEQSYRTAQGLFSLTKKYTAERIESACKHAHAQRLYQLKHIKSILTSNIDQLPDVGHVQYVLPQHHDNIRGAHTFH